MIKRITIIGISGTGKSTLARKLSGLMNIPVTHVDQHIWDENWKEADAKKAEMALNKAMENEKWIVEGYIFPCAETRLEKADLIIYLDYSGIRAMLGGIKRWRMFRGKKRPEMPEGNIESTSIEWNYLKVMFKRLERPEIEKAIRTFNMSKKLVRLRSDRETKKFLRTLLKRNITATYIT